MDHDGTVATEPGRCPDCGASMEPGDEVCRDCGWVRRAAPKGGALAVLANRAAWLVGLLYLLAAVGMALGRPPATGSAAAFGAGGVYLLPPTRRALAEVAGVALERWQVVLVAIAVFFVAWGLLPAEPPALGGYGESVLALT